MLVLSRRAKDSVVFPNLGISVHVIRVEGRTVKLGIDAPRDVPVLRHEIADQWNQWNDYPVGQKPKQLSHALRNRLNAATLGLNLLHRKMELGQFEDFEPTILKIFRELESMEKEVGQFQANENGPTATTPRRALLIEDNENESELLAGYLRTCNFHVATASDGADALEYLAYKDKPDIVLLDMNMPRLDGAKTIHEIRSNPAHADLKVFAVTGMSEHDSQVSSGPDGVDRWFMKPVKPDMLVSQINKELATRKSTA